MLFLASAFHCMLLAGFRPAGEVLFLATKKSTQKKVAPAACDPSRCEGQPVSWRLWGVPRNSLRAKGAPFEQTRQASSRSTGTLRCQRHPTNTTPQAHAKGECKQPNSKIPIGHRYARPVLGAERSDGLWVFGCWLVRIPLLHAPGAWCLWGGAGTAECQCIVN